MTNPYFTNPDPNEEESMRVTFSFGPPHSPVPAAWLDKQAEEARLKPLRQTEYILITMSAPGYMGGNWEGPHREILMAVDDEDARTQARKKLWTSIVVLFRADAEIDLRTREGE